MVSFQCHACGDVVKKPKLDQHRTRCHSGYDCIDCSKTFNSPAEYKGHTSCISEAEKYEKSLYKGPKNGVPQRNARYSDLPPATNKQSLSSTQKAPTAEEPATPAAERSSNAQWGAKSIGPSSAVAPAPTNSYVGGGRGAWGHGSWGQARNKVTGANDTPLGTPPPRASPVNVPPHRPATNGYAQTQTQKDKKRKSGAADDAAVKGDAKSNKKVKLSTEKDATVDPVSIPCPISPGPSTDDGKKKSKKEKNAEKEEKKSKKKEKAKKTEETVDVEMASSGETEKKKSKKDKKEKHKEVSVADDDGEKVKADKKKKKKDAVEESALQINGVEVNGKEKKRKRSDEDDIADADASLIEEKKKKKKDKKEKKSEDAMDVDSTPVVESTKKERKNKKDKRDKVAKSIPVAIAVA